MAMGAVLEKGARRVTTLLACVNELSAKLESISELVTEPRLVTTPVCSAVPIKVTLATPPLGRLPKSHRTVPAEAAQLPWLARAEIKLNPSGKASRRVTPVAV